MEENERPDAFASRKAIKRPAIGRDAFQEHGKLPPQAIDLEEAVLGALMLERTLWQQLLTCCRRLFFTRNRTRLFSKP